MWSLLLPSKKTLTIAGVILALLTCIFIEYKIIQSKNEKISLQTETIKAKELELSIQKQTIDSLDKSYKESIEKMKSANDKMTAIEKEYQQKLDSMILNLGNCKTDTPSDQLTLKEKTLFQGLLNKLSESTELRK